MRVFLDVGANTGQTVKAILDPKYRFDRIVCFEPDEACCRELALIPDARIEIQPFGLWKETCKKILYDPGTLGGSIFSDKVDVDARNHQTCSLVRASDWFRDNLGGADEVIMKMNCEGSECDIIDDLLDSGAYRKVTFAMIDFDVRKVPSMAHREAQVRKRLQAGGFDNYHLEHEVMIGPSHAARIRNWLRIVGQDRCSLGTRIRQGLYLTRIDRELRRDIFWGWFRHVLEPCVPRFYRWLRAKRHPGTRGSGTWTE